MGRRRAPSGRCVRRPRSRPRLCSARSELQVKPRGRPAEAPPLRPGLTRALKEPLPCPLAQQPASLVVRCPAGLCLAGRWSSVWAEVAKDTRSLGAKTVWTEKCTEVSVLKLDVLCRLWDFLILGQLLSRAYAGEWTIPSALPLLTPPTQAFVMASRPSSSKSEEKREGGHSPADGTPLTLQPKRKFRGWAWL